MPRIVIVTPNFRNSTVEWYKRSFIHQKPEVLGEPWAGSGPANIREKPYLNEGQFSGEFLITKLN